MSTADRISQILEEFKTLEPQELSNLINALSNLRTFKLRSNSDKVSPDLPALTIPFQMTPPYLEYLFIGFIKEVCKNYDSDYMYSDPKTLTNNNSLIVNSYFSDDDLKDGQYPKVAVKCESMNFSSAGLGNMAANTQISLGGGTTYDKKNCWMQFTITFDVLSHSDSEADILATLLSTNLIASMPELRALGDLTQINYPSVMFAQKVREYDKIFLSKVQFGATKEIVWTEVISEKTYNNIIISLLAVCGTRPSCKGFEQILLAGVKNSGDAELSAYVDQLEKNKENGENC